jgi:hypothetical protein
LHAARTGREGDTAAGTRRARPAGLPAPATVAARMLLWQQGIQARPVDGILCHASSTRRRGAEPNEDRMDHYIPKRRIPATLWTSERQGFSCQMFLDLDASGHVHQTLVEKLNESSHFLPVAVGGDGRIHLFNKNRILRVTPSRQVLPNDVYARGFDPWREEEAELTLSDGTALIGRVWMPLHRETQRLSDFMNGQGAGFFVLITPSATHLVNAAGVLEMKLSESAGMPLAIADAEAQEQIG